MSGRTVGARPAPARSPAERHDADLAPLAPVAAIVGSAMVVAGFAALTSIAGWTSDYGVMVIAAVLLYLAIATGLVRWEPSIGAIALATYEGATRSRSREQPLVGQPRQPGRIVGQHGDRVVVVPNAPLPYEQLRRGPAGREFRANVVELDGQVDVGFLRTRRFPRHGHLRSAAA
ncbi:hypothetical protein ACRS6B_16005 [Nocardia asteroides]